MNRFLQAGCALGALAALGLSGCASAPPRPSGVKVTPQEAPFAGSWAGTWKSETTGHKGRLLCEFTPVDETHYRADFKAYWGLLSGRYQVPFETRRRGETLSFTGEHDLGKLFGGVYRYEGTIRRGVFLTRYTASNDRGTFELRRPQNAGAERSR